MFYVGSDFYYITGQQAACSLSAFLIIAHTTYGNQ
jgi:hypothetical protein